MYSELFKGLTKRDKALYLQSILKRKIEPPKHFYGRIILTDRSGKKTLKGDPIDANFMKNLPYERVMIIPDNNR